VRLLQRILRPLAVASLALPLSVFAATPITGVVTNGTTNKPSAGDTVTLIQLAQGMQEAAHTTTDSHGRYKLDVPDEGLHLIRVTHDKANYFKPAPPGTDTVDIDVFNAAPHVKGVSTEAVVMRVQTDASGKSLTVIENIFVKNDSKPPMTQFSADPFDFYLPDGAVISGSAALAPGGMPVQATPVPLSDKGHFTFLFPIRPGESRFQISYSLPYTGNFAFDLKLSGATDTVALMMPKAMTFAPAANSPFSPVNDDETAQTLVARNVPSGQALAFTVSGSGQLPRETQTNDPNGATGGPQPSGSASGNSPDSGEPVPATDNKMPGKGLDNPLDPNGNREPWGKYKWWILGIAALLLAAAAGFLLSKPATTTASAGGASSSWPPPPHTAPVAVATPATHQQQLLQALKEEMFELETERLQNRIGETDYAEQKAALELILRRALKRTGSGNTGMGGA
jgi:hypothetical protein